jgi:hypothetical protein
MDRTIPAPAALLLDFIASFEAPHGAYETVYGDKQARLAKPLTTWTLDEIIGANPTFNARFGSSACGRYQFMRDTLRGLKTSLGLTGREVFGPDLQDRLGFHLLRVRGYDKFMAGTMSTTAFGLSIAKEWASLPVLAATTGAHRPVGRGDTYYRGDGLNNVLTTPERVEAALGRARAAAGRVPAVTAAPSAPTPPTAAAGPVSFLQRLFGRAA